jgi:DNA-binding CsgD family transcriptional regulator
LIRHAKSSVEMLIWSAEVFSEVPSLWSFMQASGLKAGLSQPSRSGSGSIALINLSRKALEISERELTEKRVKISILASILHAEMEIILMKKLFHVMPTLSNLDRSILRWTARGKTAKEIAIILDTKERSVTNRKLVITRSLDAKTFAQAMLIAYSLGFMT